MNNVVRVSGDTKATQSKEEYSKAQKKREEEKDPGDWGREKRQAEGFEEFQGVS